MPGLKCQYEDANGRVCGNSKVWSHRTLPGLGKKAYCQYHFKKVKEDYIHNLARKVLRHIDDISVQDARIARVLDYKLLEQLREAVTPPKPGRKPERRIPTKKAREIMDQLAENEDLLAVVNRLLDERKRS